MSEVEFVGEVMKTEELFDRGDGIGMIMPHVVSPEATGGEVITPPILPKSQIDQLDRALAREEREANLERQFQEKIENHYAKALAAVKNRRISVSQIQRLLGIGYAHACLIYDMLAERGAIATGIDQR